MRESEKGWERVVCQRIDLSLEHNSKCIMECTVTAKMQITIKENIASYFIGKGRTKPGEVFGIGRGCFGEWFGSSENCIGVGGAK